MPPARFADLHRQHAGDATSNRSNAFVEPMNGQLQQAKRAARGYRSARNFIAIAYLRLSRLKH